MPAQLDRWAVYDRLARLLDDDHQASHKPWSWALIGHGNGGGALRVGLLDAALVSRLHELRGADLAGLRITGPLQQLAACERSALRRGHRGCQWDVEFVTPVTIRQGDHFLPWPAPRAVLGSLRQTWQTFGADEAGPIELDLRLDPVVVLAVTGKSHTERVPLKAPSRRPATGRQGAVTVGGFLGRLTYRLVGSVDPTQVATLFRLAPFAGIGAYTLRGFGAVALPGR